MTWHKTHLLRHTQTLHLSKIYRVFQLGCTELHIIFIYDYIRSRKETNDLDAREVDAISSVEQDNLGQKMDVYQSLKTLKEIERTCITLFYMEDVSIEKIAGITGCPVGTVKSHLSRGKEKLANYLNKNGYDRN